MRNLRTRKNFSCLPGLINFLVPNDTVDSDDEEEAVAVHRKRGRGESGVALRKLEKETPGAKSKKKARVLVEVRFLSFCFIQRYFVGHFLDA